MFSKIEALNYRCLRYIDKELGPFHVLVGPNASGKTTFLDVISFLGQLVNDGLEKALYSRSPNFEDLLFRGTGTRFELAVEAQIPEHLVDQIKDVGDYDTIRYEVAIGHEETANESGLILLAENVYFLSHITQAQQVFRLVFPGPPDAPDSICRASSKRLLPKTRRIISKVRNGNDNFYSEVYKEAGKGWAPAFKLGPRKSALANLPEDESKFPVSTWLKGLLTDGVQSIVLNSQAMRRPSPPGQPRSFRTDGSNLPWVIEDLKNRSPSAFRDWIAHLQTALPDLESISTIERPEDKHRYLQLRYRPGFQIPSWTASDGTLRLLALTIPAYLRELNGVFLIEEPENGIHPKAIETVFQSLSSVYDAQMLVATHSPIILAQVKPEQLLCFAKTDEGATDIVDGIHHPMLSEWQNEVSLGTLFAAGVLG